MPRVLNRRLHQDSSSAVPIALTTMQWESFWGTLSPRKVTAMCDQFLALPLYRIGAGAQVEPWSRGVPADPASGGSSFSNIYATHS